MFKQAEKVDNRYLPSQLSQSDGVRDSAFTPTFTQPSREPSQPSPTKNESGIPSPSPECEGSVKADVKVDVKAGTQSGQGCESCEGTFPKKSPGRESSPENASSGSPPELRVGMKVKSRSLEMGLFNEGVLTLPPGEDGEWGVFWEHFGRNSREHPDNLIPIVD
ncbi:hypothetical protein PN466_13840 [Roseofilum reptotaenium CS-1145]|uniref:Uncharacterized protein n=1 Tax=Roseofilum reptotaenium AO1-A TaxID=1925591 RepID=A0A1L9QW80_9CYAN|nr:hypothetical protein [Roseofilum reptotaenium]MDB9518028.1 hypothetical protein [Roseofilum reptotaenium CS-1145]OJJ26886.1 hypothetical protein BI308_04125 [Roseofilum reptotaenium AO1-A]